MYRKLSLQTILRRTVGILLLLVALEALRTKSRVLTDLSTAVSATLELAPVVMVP